MFFDGKFGHWALSVKNNRINYHPVGLFYAKFRIFFQLADPCLIM